MFIAGERHLTAYVDGKKVIDITYAICNSSPKEIVFYDQNEQKATRIYQRINWGVEKIDYKYSGPNDDTYIKYYYSYGIPLAKFEYRGNDSRTIVYTSDGLVDSMEETINGITNVYTYRKELVERKDETQPSHPVLMTDYYHTETCKISQQYSFADLIR